MVTNAKLEDHLIDMLKNMSGLHMGKAMLTDIDLSLSQMVLLRWVAQSPGCHVQKIADGLGLSAPTVSVGVRKLIQAGLLERLPDPKDRRATCVFLSEKGKGLQQQFIKSRHAGVRRFLGGLTSEEQEQLITLLDKAFKAMEKNKLSIKNEMKTKREEVV